MYDDPVWPNVSGADWAPVNLCNVVVGLSC